MSQAIQEITESGPCPACGRQIGPMETIAICSVTGGNTCAHVRRYNTLIAVSVRAVALLEQAEGYRDPHEQQAVRTLRAVLNEIVPPSPSASVRTRDTSPSDGGSPSSGG